MGSEKENENKLLPFNTTLPGLIQREFGSIIRATGIDEVYETLIVPRVVDEDLGYHFMMSHFLSKDRMYCVTAGTDGLVALWDLRTGKAERIYKGHTGHVTSVCMTPDNNTIISGGKDKTIRIWDRESGECRVLDRLMDSIYCLAINNDGSFIASGGKDNIVRLWQVDSGRLIKSYKLHKLCVLCISFSSDNRKILSGGADGKCIEWSLFSDSNRVIFQGSNIIDALAVSPDDRYLLLGGRIDSIFLIDLENGKVIKELETNRMTVFDIAFSMDNRLAAICGKPRYLHVYEFPSGKCIKTFSVNNEHIHKIDFLDNSGTLLSSSGDTAIRLWNLDSGKPETITKCDIHVIRSIAIHMKEHLLAAGIGTGEVKIWDIATCRLRYVLRGHTGLVRSSVFHSIKPYLYTASWDGTIMCWDMTTGSLRRKWQGPGERIYSVYLRETDNSLFVADHNGSIIHMDEDLNVRGNSYNASEYCYAVTANNRFLAAGSGPYIVVWDLLTGAKRTLQLHKEDVYSLFLTPENSLLLSAAMDGTISLWDIHTGNQLRHYKGHDGRTTFVTLNKQFTSIYSLGTDALLRQWKFQDGECIGVYKGHTSPTHTGVLVEEKNLFISGGDDGILYFWDIGQKKKGENGNIDPLAALFVYPDHYLWVLEPETEKKDRWFFSEQTGEFTVAKKNNAGTSTRILPPGDLDRETYLRVYNRPDIVSAALFNREKYIEMILQLSKKVLDKKMDNNIVKRISRDPDNHIP